MIANCEHLISPAVVVHYVVVGTVLLFSAIWFAYHNCNWYKQIAARNDHLKPSRFADSALFGGYISGAGLQQQDSQVPRNLHPTCSLYFAFA
eukprot:SAG31_NODE_3_length_45830_cov_42.279701_30_plen_92_part_00